MKNLVAFLVFVTMLFSFTAGANVYYCSPTGNDSNAGTIDKPFATWEKLYSVLNAGDTGYVRGGTYRTTKAASSNAFCRFQDRSGTAGNTIKIWAYPGENPVFNLDNIVPTAASTVFAVYISNASYLHIKGLRVSGLAQNSNGVNYTYGFAFFYGSNNTVEQCESDHNSEGFNWNNQVNIQLINCDAHHNQDPYSPNPYNGSNGFSSTGGQPASTSATLTGCRSWWNCDDGYDLFLNDGTVTYNNCWSFWNGYIPGTFTPVGNGDGFKLGPTVNDLSTSTRHFLNNCVSFQNLNQGFDQNDGRCINQLYNCTSYGNGGIGYHLSYQSSLNIKHVLKNNISFQDKSAISSTASWVQSNNTWNGITATAASFASLSNAGMDGARQSDGSLPNLQFLHLSASSNLINAGVSLPNLSFSGSAPDLGAFEYSGTTSPSNQAPVANAGTNQTITLPANSVTLDGSNSKDPDGTISAYAWSKVSGPSQGSITNVSSASTTATSLVQGTYIFKLTVTDNSNATGSDSVIITVNGIPNQAPIANAGSNKTITLPVNTVTLDGSASSDVDGTINSYSWVKASGPSQGSITNASSVSTTATNLVQGTYVFRLTVRDNGNATGADSVIITVNAAANQAPVANAGANKTITLPTNTITLDGSASSDADGTISSYSWVKASGPSQGSIANTSSASTTATNLVQGTYVFRLTVKDNGNATGTDSVIITVNAAANQAPVANAGSNKTITLPVNTVTLDGSASSDADGTINSYSWVKASGPSQGSITNASSVSTTATNLVQGTYVFRLTVKDNGNATGADSVIITVNAAANQAPVANAGANKTITLPVNTVTLDGSASSDADGTISSYSWVKASGPSQGSIANTSSASTTATNLVQGTYIFRLTVKDNGNATGTDSVIITVNAAANQAPVANAGSNKTITLPVNTVTLDGSASSDADGTISSFSWAKIAGAAVTISNVSTATATISGLAAGQYTFELTVTDDKGASAKATVRVTVLNAAAQNPVADAGKSQVITLPLNSVTLDGSGSLDPDGSISNYSWTKISGPFQGSIANASAATTTATNLVQGVYMFKLTVRDNSNLTGSDSITITVNAVPNQAPVANAGSNKTITLPINTVTLDGSASSDADGTISSYSWTKVAGGAASINNGATATPTISGLTAGRYTFELTVTDDKGATSRAQVKVAVNAAPNQPPVASAGSNKTITLPVNTVILDGSGSTDADGTIISYSWTKIAGGSVSISNVSTSTATISGLTAGQYTFELTVTDDKGATSKAQVRVKVNPAPNQPAVANAGSNKTITLPTNTVTLDGSGSTDADGTITSYNWTKITGGTANISNGNKSLATVSGLAAGQYTFELTITDDKGAISRAQVKITVNPAPNQAPVADAGASQTLPFGTTSVTLDGSKSTDPDGTITIYDWQLVSGPDVTITNGNSAKPVITGLQGGQYIFELTVTDNVGATSKAQVKIIVNLSTNLPPVANAGANQIVTLPVSSTKLDGVKSYDPDGTIESYVWTKMDGPSPVTITNVNTSTPIISGLTEGVYSFKLTVTDNRGASTTAQVKITVQKPSGDLAPVADAGTDQAITLPASNNKTASVRLDGTKSYDADGSIVYYTWKKITGTSAVTIDNVNTASSNVSGLQVGQYTFELTVTDNNGISASDQVTIVVKPANSQSPVADAGKDIAVSLPESTAVLDGSGSHDSQGGLTYKWEQVQGPSASALSSVTAPKITVKSLEKGIYIFRLTVTSTRGEEASDEVKITVTNGPQTVQMELYPNPASDVINAKIISDSIGVVVVNIYDINGRAVKKVELNKQLVDNLRQQVQRVNANTTQTFFTLPVNITSLGKGVYIIETIIDTKTRVSSKFVKY